ncbi:MAG: FG-GAP repeat protein, partial [Giesbergeria sp.]
GGCSAATAPLVPDLTQAIGYFKASGAGSGGSHGWSVALSADGSTLAVGAPGDRMAGLTGTVLEEGGAIEVYARSSAGWVHQARLKAAHASQLGYSLALSADGSVLVAGAPTESSGATGINGDQADRSAEYAGAVYAFTRSGSTWTQKAYIKASNTHAGAGFGFPAALSQDGSTLGVGAYGEGSASAGIDGNQNDRSAPRAGAVYVFARSGAAWSQQAYIKASNA